MIRLVSVFNRQGKVRLAKYYMPFDDAEKVKINRELHAICSTRHSRASNFTEVRLLGCGRSQLGMGEKLRSKRRL